MARAHLILIIFALTAPLAAGCSLMGLDDIPLRSCETDDDCEIFNSYEGLPEGCQAYYCLDGDCLRHPEGQELFDGVDNDCDGVIDEPSIDGSQTISSETTVAVNELVPSSTVHFGVDATGSVSAAWTDNRGDAMFTPITGATVQGQEMTYLRGAHEPGNTNGNPLSMREPELEEGCYRLASDGSVIPGNCGFSEVAFGLSKQQVLMASINTEGCAVGQLRVGSFVRGSPPDVVLRGPIRRSNSYLGIDLTETGACTGASRDACTDAGAGCGVARPAVTVFDIDLLQGLVGWIGDQQDRDVCGGSEAPVEVMELFQASAMFGSRFYWLNGSNEAVGQPIGSTVGGGAPALLSLGEDGYIVAFGNQDGDLELHFVPTSGPPPELDDPLTCTDPCTGFDDRAGLELDPLTGMVELGVIDGGDSGSVDHVALAFGASGEGELDLGVAWVGGCGTADQVVAFRRLTLSTTGAIPDGLSDEGAVQRLSDAEIVGSPAVVYVPSGFVTDGYERGGAGPATAENDGGWVVSWPAHEGEQSRLMGRRIAELDGLILDETEHFDLASTSADAALTGPGPVLYISEGALRFAYHRDGGQEIIVGEIPNAIPVP